MNILGYEPKEREQYYNYLLSIGFNENGAMLTGWFEKSEGWYYANSNGSLALGWKKSGGRWYYLDGNNSEHPGLMAENTNMLINGKYYGFNANGAMLTRSVQIFDA